jgi:F0F1-type ATP synthase membrane subunit c/vacuolar-type H+-ATPase subunit K
MLKYAFQTQMLLGIGLGSTIAIIYLHGSNK